MNNKKTMIGLVAGIGMMLMLSIFPQKLTLAGPGNDCFWGFASVERGYFFWQNNGTTKLCDCTLVSYIIDGNHIPCPQPE